MLSELIMLALLTAGVGSSQCGRLIFSPRLIRFCLRPQFLFEPSFPAASALLCGLLCASRGDRCRGFRLTAESSSGCQTLEFDRCSHMANQNSCSRFEWAYVRKQDGLEEGQLCPGGYGSGRLGSTYKMIDVTSWTDGLSKCNSEPGLTKFADGMDASEVAHVQGLKTTLNANRTSNMRGFYVGGYRTLTYSTGTWYWQDCNATFLPEVWGPGEPNESADSSHNRADVWYSYPTGLDDEREIVTLLKRALCECINPFV